MAVRVDQVVEVVLPHILLAQSDLFALNFNREIFVIFKGNLAALLVVFTFYDVMIALEAVLEDVQLAACDAFIKLIAVEHVAFQVLIGGVFAVEPDLPPHEIEKANNKSPHLLILLSYHVNSREHVVDRANKLRLEVDNFGQIHDLVDYIRKNYLCLLSDGLVDLAAVLGKVKLEHIARLVRQLLLAQQNDCRVEPGGVNKGRHVIQSLDLVLPQQLAPLIGRPFLKGHIESKLNQIVCQHQISKI